MKTTYFFLFSILILSFSLPAQSGLIYSSEDATQGYVLVEYDSFSGTYLLDNCGEVVHEWDVFDTDNHPKLLPNGNLLYMRNSWIYERAWDSSIEVSIDFNEPGYVLNYEVVKLANGNYLCLGRKSWSFIQFVEMGYNLAGVSPAVVDVVLEIDPAGQIVWEWNIADHAIQERDPALGNYGVVADNPGLIDMDRISDFDWENYESFMINGMDYNPELDQIALSVRKVSEVMIIDHSTTTAEAAGHTGGTYGKGGDILYRWGNPQNYGRGTAADRFLYYQHNPNWIEHGANKGKLICYNNGLDRPGAGYNNSFSEVPIFDAPEEADGSYILPNTGPYLPVQPEKVFSGQDQNHPFYSGYTSGGEVIESGHTFITIGRHRRMIELDANEEIVWDYILPGFGYLFRSEKYDADYPAFEDKTLTPLGVLPGSLSTFECMEVSSIEESVSLDESFVLDYITPDLIQIYRKDNARFDYRLIDMNGRLLKQQKAAQQHEISLDQYASGIYMLYCKSEDDKEIFVRKIFRH